MLRVLLLTITPLAVTHAAILVESQNFPIAQVFLPPPTKKGVLLELGTGTGDQKCEWWGNRAKKKLTITSNYVTDGWTDRWTNGHGMTAKTALMCNVLRTASNSVNVLLHRLNNTHLLTYCSAQLTQTINCKHRLQYFGFSVSIGIIHVSCSYSYSSLPGIITLQNEC